MSSRTKRLIQFWIKNFEIKHVFWREFSRKAFFTEQLLTAFEYSMVIGRDNGFEDCLHDVYVVKRLLTLKTT